MKNHEKCDEELIIKEIEIIIEKEERERYFSEIQARMEEEGIIPETPSLLLRRFKRLLEYTGGVCLGAFVGSFILLINFVIFVYFLHLDF